MRSYARLTMLADDDPRHDSGRWFLEPATLDDVLPGLERACQRGDSLAPCSELYIADDGSWRFHGNLRRVSAAFDVEVPDHRLDDIRPNLRRWRIEAPGGAS